MSERPWEQLTRREKDQRRVEAYKAGVRDRVEALTAGGMDRDAARDKAKRDQEVTSNRAWETYRREDGQK